MGKTSHNYKNYALLAILGLAVFLGGISIYSNNLTKEDGATELGLVHGSTTRSGLAPAPTVNADCMMAAIDGRDKALSQALDIKNRATALALSQRAIEQQGIWQKVTSSADRRANFKVVLANYKKSVDNANKEWRTARKAAWDKYAKNRKYCGTAAVADDSGFSEGIDGQL